MCHLFLLRHGATEYTTMDIQQGQLDVPLSAAGVEQAQALARRFADAQLTAVYSSTLERSERTAEILAARHDLEVRTEPTLRERSVGDFEGEPISLVREHLTDLDVNWSDWKPPNGETRADAVARAQPTIKELAERHAHERIAVVAHSGINKGLLAAFLGAGARFGHRLGQDLACVNELEHHAGEWYVHRVNDIAHL